MTINTNTIGHIVDDFTISATCVPCRRFFDVEKQLVEKAKKYPHMTIIQFKSKLFCNKCGNKEIDISQIYKTSGSIPKDWNGNI